MTRVYVLERWDGMDDGHPVGVFTTVEKAMEASGVVVPDWEPPNHHDGYWNGASKRPGVRPGQDSWTQWLIFELELDKAPE